MLWFVFFRVVSLNIPLIILDTGYLNMDLLLPSHDPKPELLQAPIGPSVGARRQHLERSRQLKMYLYRCVAFSHSHEALIDRKQQRTKWMCRH